MAFGSQIRCSLTSKEVPCQPRGLEPPLRTRNPCHTPFPPDQRSTWKREDRTGSPRTSCLSLRTRKYSKPHRKTAPFPRHLLRKNYKPLLTVSTKTAETLQEDERDATEEWLYRFEPLKGVRTQSLIYQFNGNLALEGTVEATPMGETDPDLADFGFRTVHALNFLRDRPTPSIMMGYDMGVHSGYPLSYGIGLNYQVSPLVNLRFDYSFETPNDYLVEYNGSWESSLMTNYNKSRSDNPLSIHSFFLGFRYLVQTEGHPHPSSYGLLLFDEHGRRTPLVERFHGVQRRWGHPSKRSSPGLCLALSYLGQPGTTVP